MVTHSLLFIFTILLSYVDAFSFTASTPSECDNLTVEWEGGTGPFQLLFVPVFGTPRNISIPATAVTGTKGSFSTPVPFPAGQKLVLTMSDSTGFGAGGTTNLLTVEPSKGASCDSSDPGVAFAFQLNMALQQCRPFRFEGYRNAIQPVTISMVIPGGQSAVVRPPVGGTDYSWVANVAAGTSMIFMMTDARGAQGGASDIRIVGASDDSSCINGNSPSSTLQPTSTSSSPSQTSTSTSQSSAGSTQTGKSEAPVTTPISAIAGTVIGSLLFLAVIVTLGLFFLKNWKKKMDKKKQQTTDFHQSKPSAGTFYDSTGRSPNPYGTPQSHYPHSPNSAVPFDNPFSDGTSMGNMSSPDPNLHYPYQQQPDPFNTPRPYYPPPPIVPPSQDPFNPADSSLPGAMNYSANAPTSHPVMGQSHLGREPSASQTTGSGSVIPVKDDGFTQPAGQRKERRRQPSRGFSVTNPSPRQQNTSLPHPDSSPFM